MLTPSICYLIIFRLIKALYFYCCKLNQISKWPNSDKFEGIGVVRSFLVQIIPLNNLSYGGKCPFGIPERINGIGDGL